VIRIIPVSVCHQVSTTGALSPPMCSRYQIQASGLIGSPTVPSSLILERSCFCAYSGPHFMCERIAVEPCREWSRRSAHKCPTSGPCREVGRSSKITDVAWLASGP